MGVIKGEIIFTCILIRENLLKSNEETVGQEVSIRSADSSL
jgi:hypothetical protein